MRSFVTFVLTALVLTAIVAVARTQFGAEVGEPCTELILSCRATCGVFSVNACVRTGPDANDSFCTHECEIDGECPEGWTCAAADAWSNVPGAVEDVRHACRPPGGRPPHAAAP